VKKLLGPLFAAAFGGALLTLGVGQEVPLGRLTGRVTMKENGKPLEGALVTVVLKGTPDEERPQVKGVETNAKGEYTFASLPAGDYTLSVSAQEHSLDDVKITVKEGKGGHKDVAAKPNDPYLNLYASQRVFLPNETPRVELHGFVPQKAVRMRVLRLDERGIAEAGGYDAALLPLVGAKTGASFPGETVVDTDKTVQARDAEGAFVQTLPVGALKEGVYYVDTRAGDKEAHTVLLVSRLAIVTKTGTDGTLVFATDLKTGEPVAGAAVFARVKGRLERKGTTGADGTLRTPIEDEENRGTVMASKGGSVAIAQGYHYGNERRDVWIDAYPERPAYRPGDTVQFKGFVRRIDGDGYRLPGEGTATVTIKDPDENELKTLSLPISVHGSFHGSFTTSKEGKPGNYSMAIKALGGTSNAYANVVAYRKPEFSIEVTSSKPHYTMGDKAAATVECKYYYGGPVVGAKVKATVYRSPVYRYENEDGEQQAGDSYGGGEYSQEVEAVTDAAGRATVEFETTGENDPAVLTNDYTYTVSASVTEDGGKYFDGEGQVPVTRGDFAMSMEVQNPVLEPGDTAEIRIRTTDAVDPSQPVGGRTVTVETGRMAYAEGGSTFVKRATATVTTDAKGEATLRVPVTRAESLDFRATGRDDAGRKIVAETSAWVDGSPARAEERRGDLSLTLDHRSYTEGQKARVLLQTDMPGGSALVTLQTDRILWQKIVPLEAGSTVVETPIVREYAPNVYVSAAYVRDKKFLQADRRLRVAREDRRLKIEVTPEKAAYRPGETARVVVKTTDADGKPVAAEVSVGTVDAGIYDVAKDDTDLYASLYPERSNGVNTAYSFPEIYLDGGDKGSSKIPLRKDFKDTAGWTPAVWTGEGGETTVDVPLPDNLTEWRVTAIGMSDATQTGKTVASFKSRKPLMVRLGLPQFLVEGDHQRLTATIANDTGADADVSIELGVSGLTLADPAPKTLRVPAGKPQIVELDVDAPGAGTGTVTARVAAGAETDGVEQSFPILAHGRPILETRAGEGPADFDLPFPPDLDPKLGSLKITVSPTLAGDLGKALDGLIDFPYGCVEQTMSRFMPALLVEQTVKRLGLPAPKRLDKLPQIAADSLARLAQMRHGDGGWGWWAYDESDPFMTALVLDGLKRAQKAGYDVSSAGPDAAADWGLKLLQDKAKLKAIEPRDRLYLIYALLRWDKKEAAGFLKGVDLRDRTQKDPYDPKRRLVKPTAAELATGALAYQAAGKNPDALLDLLKKRARVGEETAEWAPEEGAWGEEATALALVALQTSRPDDVLLPRIVRGLMRSRHGDGWSSTRDTAYALVGLTMYLDHTKELAGTSTATVLVDGKERGSFTLDPRAEDPTRTVEIPRGELGDRAKIEIRTTGKVYRTIALSGFEVAKELKAKATDRELSVERRTFLMEPRRGGDGTLRLLPSEKPVTEFKNGDVVRVELTLKSDKPREFVLVEEPTPSSCRVTERTELEEGEEKDWWWSQTVVLDDHLAFFARNLPKGESKIVYHMRAEQAGRATALPARVQNMYDPGRWASTAETRVAVER